MPLETRASIEAKTDLAYAVISDERVPVAVLQDLFLKVQSAATDRELLDCLVLLSENDINIQSTIEALCSGTPSGELRETLIGILFELLDKLPPAMMQVFLATASEIKDIRGLIRLLVILKENGINIATLKTDLAGIFNGRPVPVAAGQTQFSASSGPVHAPAKTDPASTDPDQTDDALPLSAADLAFCRILSGPVDGMKAPKGNGEFKNSPQKDLTRAIWADRVQKRFGTMSDAARSKLKVFSLLGEEARDLSGYENLGIPRENIHAAEFAPAVYARMVERFPGLRLFSGNCCSFFEAARRKTVNLDGGFDVMNLDICGTAGEFFSSGDAQILWLLAQNSEFCINTRVRQDASDLDEAHAIFTVLSGNFPELKEYLEKLKLAKTHLFPDEIVALNMALRDFYVAFKLAASMPNTESSCANCKKVVQETEKQLKTVQLAVGRYVSDPEETERIGAHPLDFYVYLFEVAQNPAILEATEKFPPQSFQALERRLKQESRKLTTSGGRGLANADLMSFIRRIEADYLENHADQGAKAFTDEEIKYLKIFIDYFFLLQWGPLIRRYTTMTPASVKRVTYTHDSNHTFESWMLSMEKAKTPTTVIGALKMILDKMLNSEDTFIDGKCQTNTYKPEQKNKVKIAPDRLIDAHQLPCGHKRRQLSPKEIAHRRSKRAMAQASRKLNRKRES